MIPDPSLEFHETPEAHTRWLFESVGICGTVFDPCAGSGAIRRGAGDTFALTSPTRNRVWIESDIDPAWQRPGLEQWDATDPAMWAGLRRRIDWVVTNTPFSKLIQIADLALRSVRYSGGVALYGRVSINEPLETGIRRTWMHDNAPHQILFLPRFAYQRNPKTGAYSTDSAACCWLVWYPNDLSPRSIRSIDYAPEDVIARAHAERATYRERMDALMGYTGTEDERRAARIARAKGVSGE